MALVLTDAKLWVAGFDLSGDSNSIALDYGADPKENTTFGLGVHSFIGGLKTVALQNEGFWEADGTSAPDDVLYPLVGTKVPVSVAAVGAVGDVAYTFEALKARYTTRQQVGEPAAFTVEASASGGQPLVRGFVLFNGDQVGDGAGTIRDYGLTSGLTLYAAVHVLALGAGTSLVVSVQGDQNAVFGTPVDYITFNAFTDIGAQFSSLLLPIPDDHFRVNFDFTGGVETATAVVIVGVQ